MAWERKHVRSKKRKSSKRRRRRKSSKHRRKSSKRRRRRKSSKRRRRRYTRKSRRRSRRGSRRKSRRKHTYVFVNRPDYYHDDVLAHALGLTHTDVVNTRKILAKQKHKHMSDMQKAIALSTQHANAEKKCGQFTSIGQCHLHGCRIVDHVCRAPK